MRLQISSGQLSLGTRGDDVAQVQQALQALGREVSAAERTQRIFGPETAAVIKALQAQLNVTATGVIDAATVRVINARLAGLDTETRVVRGRVHDAEDAPFVAGFVQVFQQSPAGEQVVGKSPIDAKDGSYLISYTPPPDNAVSVDIRVAVLSGESMVETEPGGASILTNAGPLEVVDFTVATVARPPRSDFERMQADLAPLLGRRNIADLSEGDGRYDVSMLAAQSGYPSEKIAALVQAHQMERDRKVPAPVFYALLDQGLPANGDALLRSDARTRADALTTAVARGAVPKQIGDKKIEDYLPDLVTANATPLQGLLGHVLNANDLNTFVGRYVKESQDPAVFWKQLETDPAWAGRTADLKFAVQLGALTNNNTALVAALRARADIRQASDLVRLTADDWKSLIATQGVGVSAETPGADDREKVDNYADALITQVEAAFPTSFFAERLGASPIATFLKENPTYDLRKTYPPQFFKSLPAGQPLGDEDRRQLRSLQRLYRLTGNAHEAIALKDTGSAQRIARMDPAMFAKQYKDVLPSARVAEIHASASRRAALALALVGENASAFNRTSLRALPTTDLQKQKELAQNSIPDWETLFGSFDFCACRECASAHGAAAYLVDVLRFLGDRGARPALFARRADLGEIELSCENTNTTLPLIDIVNEVLENAIAPPPPFAPFTLALPLEADLSGTVATAALSAAFTPPLRPSATIETLEPGKRWCIQDDAFSYGVHKDQNDLKVATRSRQTKGSSSERRASPQYRNSDAYGALGQAVYPWSLPFDLPSAEARVFLTHLGVPRHDLIGALLPQPATFDVNDPRVILLAAERLGLTDIERKIVVGEPLTPPRQPEDFWGGTPLAALESVRDVLDRSGLSYAELDVALATNFINPAGTASIAPRPGAPLDTCDTEKLQVLGLTPDVLDRLHRFVRIWRKLDWTIPEFGFVLSAFAANAGAPVLNNEMLVRLDHLRAVGATLRLPLAATLALWRPLDTAEPGSQYRSVFYNPSVFKPQDDAFRLRPDGQELAATDKLLADHADALRAAFRLDPASLALLIARTDGKLTLGNLSTLNRHTVLARQLGLTIPNLLIVADLAGIDPFGLDHSQDTLRFIDIVKAIQASGFDIPQLDYLLCHRFNPAAPFVPTDASLAQSLEGIRRPLLAIDAASPADREAQARSVVIDRVAVALGLPADLCGQLLERLMHGGENARQRLLALAENTAPMLSRDNAAAQFETLEKLLKITTVIQTIKLPASQLDWLFVENSWLTIAPDPSVTPTPFESWFSLIELQQVQRNLSLDTPAVESILGAMTAIRAAVDDAGRLAGKQAFADALSRWLGWAEQDVATLIGAAADLNDRGLLQVQLPQDYRIGLVARLGGATGAVKRLGVPATVARQWCETSVTEAVAAAVRGAAKSKYDDAAWQTLATPLQDSLREQQRAALVAYLITRPQIWGASAGSADSNDLFAHFLIDVEMSACQLTSRIQQAIASTQLFAQRCLMGLESDVQADDPKWSQWSWMKTFRVWEASRKIWLYPENWIEPELRDDKTPFFKELENELMQAELDDDAAEQAFTHYLEKLDQVARLEIAGVYEDDDKTLHVFGRTFHTPRTYFYRRREGGTKTWTPWEKVELDIEGDHLIPVLWNGKLMLIWPIFTEKQQNQQVVMPSPGSKVNSGARYLEIQLAWSEYQRGRWSGKVVSDPATFMAYQGDDKVLFGDRIAAPQNSMRIRDDGGMGGDIPSDGGGGGAGGHPGGSLPPAPTSPSGDPKPVVRPELFSFKALTAGDTLSVRGYLRRDYRSAPTSGDAQIAYPFGEFRFSGCRKIVTAVPNGQVARRNFALAPSGTKFDQMWFTETASPLILFDGTFPTFPNQILPTVQSGVNEPASIAGNPSSTLVNKLDIPVLDRTPWTYRLLAPHQDLQFVGDRPFFFMDDRRTFIGRSTGVSGKRPRFTDWINANLATVWRADFFSTPAATPPTTGHDPAPALAEAASRPLTMLARTRDFRRVPREMVQIDLKPNASPQTLLPVFWTTRQYQFANFHHPYVCEFVKALRRQGLPALLSLDSQEAADPASFDAYRPRPRVTKAYPIDEVEFASGGAYEIYNWELFFHIPLLIASRLSSNQRFEDAQRWFHFIFDPTGASGGSVPQRYWRTKPFFERLSSDYEAESVKTIEELIAQGPPDALRAAIEVWRADPFNPHAIARLRTTTYQKTVVMKYVDNLVAWADQLFRADTLETINEAAQLYVLAAEILGHRPEIIDRNLNRVVETFNSLEPRLGELGNALQDIELLIGDSDDAASNPSPSPSLSPDLPDMSPYFPVPVNDKLLSYWDTIGARLFNIRHCMNIEGQVRQLPLFEPPIDPALLVRARAAGLSIGEVLSDMSVSLPNQRFEAIAQKANEITAEVRNLGAALMVALEKRDGEALSTLRSGQELRMLQAIRDVRVAQVDEAETNITALERSRDLAQARKTFYESRETLNALELTSLVLLGASAAPIEIAAHLRILAGLVQRLGNVKVGSPTTAGVEVGGYFIGVGVEEAAIALDAAASILNISSQVIGRTADHGRRKEEWDLQAELATIELKQIDQQLAAAQIRRAMADADLRNHDRQIEDARDADDFLGNKFTSQDLYDWTIGKVSGLYFQSYQLAYDLAKRAEMCMQHELGMKYGETSIIRFGYWDSLKKGLMAGDHLAYDLKRLEVSYLDGNIREYELTKHVSLVGLAAAQLIALKETGVCEFEIPEWLFDLDTAGHFMRRLKAVSITIPCVTGPYTTVHCKVTLLKSAYRRTADIATGYDRRAPDDPSGADQRFVDDRKILESIVTSSGQSDSGLFEMQGRDERYLPFEGAGAVSRWRLELPMQFKTFDYNTISDVILHLRYTARDGGEALRTAAAAAVTTTLGQATTGVLVRLFSLRHEFPSEWARFASTSVTGASSITVDMSAKRFPYFTQGRTIVISNAEAIVRNTAGTGQTSIAPGTTAADPSAGAWSGQGAPGAWTVTTTGDPKRVDDVFVLFAYSLRPD